MFSEKIIYLLTWNWIWSITSLLFAIFIVYYVSIKLSEQLNLIWKKLKLSPWIRWATFDAIWWSLPELLVWIIALFILWNKWLEVWVWTIGGSAIYNILIIPFLSALFYKKNKIKKNSLNEVNKDIIFFIITIFILVIGLFTWELFILWISLILFYIIYIFVLFHDNKIYRKDHKHKLKKSFKKVKNNKVNIIWIIIYLFILYIIIDISVRSILFIGSEMWISNFVISLILLAILTSSPDTILWIKASEKWKFSSSLWNAVWSNIFNICIGLGLPLLIWVSILWLHPKIDFSSMLPIFWFLVLATFIYMIIIHINKLKKIYFSVFLITYFSFIWYLLILY